MPINTKNIKFYKILLSLIFLLNLKLLFAQEVVKSDDFEKDQVFALDSNYFEKGTSDEEQEKQAKDKDAGKINSSADKISIEEKNDKKDSKDSTENNIYLNFENASLSSVVNYIAEQRNLNIIPRKDLDAINVTLTTREALSIDRAWKILLTLLDLNNFTLINVDGLYRIIPKGENKQEPLPMYSSTGTDPQDLPDGEVLRYIYFLKHIKVDAVQNILQSMLEGSIQINNDLKALILTDKGLNIKTAMKIVQELDLGGLRESIKIIPLKYCDAQDITTLFGEIIPKEDKGSIRFLTPNAKKSSTYFSTETKIFPEPRNNNLILLGTEKNIDKIIEFIYKNIDVPLTSSKSRLHVKEIKYAKAESLAPILTSLVKSTPGADKKLGEYKLFENVVIAADGSQPDVGGGGNRLIISCNSEDWPIIESFVDKLDKPQPQVAFEVMVVDVSINGNNELWGQFQPKKSLGAGVNAQFRTAYDKALNSADMALGVSLPGTTTITAGKPTSLWAVVQATLYKNNYNIITQPFVTANNNQPCVVDAIETRMVAGAFKDNKFGTVPIQETRPKDAHTNVTLTPKINLNGIINLKIEVTITDFQDQTATGANTNDRKLTTQINVGTGEVLVLGGLTKSSNEEDEYKVPVLGDIPILGNLFKSKTKTTIKSNLYIFIRPSIIKPHFEGAADEYTQLKLDYAKYQILNADTYVKEKDPIQRWFFKPEDQAFKNKLADAKQGIFRPVDDFTYGAKQPKSINIKRDPYFRGAEAVAIEEKKAKKQNLNGNNDISNDISKEAKPIKNLDQQEDTLFKLKSLKSRNNNT